MRFNARTASEEMDSQDKLVNLCCCLQDHYDFGMRAVKTVISAAGNLKRENPDMDEVRSFFYFFLNSFECIVTRF